MFCEQCGNPLKEGHKFCTKCGNSNTPGVATKTSQGPHPFDQKWWFRLMKVIYITLYIPLPFLLLLTWDDSESFWAILTVFIVYIVIVRLIKITFFYITFGEKPKWKREFKKFL